MTALPTRLPRLLSLLPRDGLNATVYQSRWHALGLPTPANSSDSQSCRWEIKRVKLSFDTTQSPTRIKANAYGVLYWKGKRVTPEDKEMEKVKGAYKYDWQAATPPPLLVEQSRQRLQAKNQAATTVTATEEAQQ